VFSLNNLQKKSLINFLRPFILTEESEENQSIDDYNQELNLAIGNVKKGNFTSLGDLEKEMESW
jgi:hypothetical protein